MVFTADQKPDLGLISQAHNKKENERTKSFVLKKLRSRVVVAVVEKLRKRKPVSGVNFFCSSCIGNKKMPYEFLLILLHSWVDSILPDDRSLSSVSLSLEN